MKSSIVWLILAFYAITSSSITNPDVLIRDAGSIYFYEQEWKMEFIFNLDEFYKNIKTINRCISELKNVCSSNPNIVNCKYFLEYVSIHYANIDKDITQIKKLSRHKRGAGWGLVLGQHCVKTNYVFRNRYYYS